jgi:hypothetical protein
MCVRCSGSSDVAFILTFLFPEGYAPQGLVTKYLFRERKGSPLNSFDSTCRGSPNLPGREVWVGSASREVASLEDGEDSRIGTVPDLLEGGSSFHRRFEGTLRQAAIDDGGVDRGRTRPAAGCGQSAKPVAITLWSNHSWTKHTIGSSAPRINHPLRGG